MRNARNPPSWSAEARRSAKIADTLFPVLSGGEESNNVDVLTEHDEAQDAALLEGPGPQSWEEVVPAVPSNRIER